VQTITKPSTARAFTGPAFGRDPATASPKPWPQSNPARKCLRLARPLNVEVDYVKVNSAGDPTPPYPGAEADAPWRAVAARSHRRRPQSDLHVAVTDALGHPLPNATVGVHMQQHEFGFGSACRPSPRENDPAQDMYKQKIQQLFNNHHDRKPSQVATVGSRSGARLYAGASHHRRRLAAPAAASRSVATTWSGPANLDLPQSVNDILNAAPLNAKQQQQLRDMIAVPHSGRRQPLCRQAQRVGRRQRAACANHDIMDKPPRRQRRDGGLVS